MQAPLWRNSDSHCLQTSLLIFNFANHRTKESFVSSANKPLVGTLMTIADVTVSIATEVYNNNNNNNNNNNLFHIISKNTHIKKRN